MTPTGSTEWRIRRKGKSDKFRSSESKKGKEINVDEMKRRKREIGDKRRRVI